MEFGVFSFIPTKTGSILVLPLLYWGFYLALISARPGITFDFLGILIIIWRDDSGDSITKANSTCPPWPGKTILSSSCLQELSRRRKSKRIHKPTWCACSLESLVVSYEDSHVLCVFLHNTSLHVTQDFFLL